MQAILDSLNPEQRQAATCIDGPVLVVAGAGSGKTRVITARIIHLISLGVSPYQILAMTFTNKAAQEMRHRVADSLGETAVRDLTITTFHSFCARFLRREIGLLDRDPGFVIFDSQDQLACMKRVIRNLDLSEKTFPAALFRNKLSYKKNLGGEVEAESDVERDIYNAYSQAMLDQNALDFDDLLGFTCKILEERKDCRERYQQRFQHIMVDEYQDTNKIQARLLDLLLNERRNLCVVGDEDQSIYGWRGADIHNILDFEQRYPRAQVFKLEQNYRSSQRILDYANVVIAANEMRKPKKLWTESGPGSPISIRTERNGLNEAETIIQKVQSVRQKERFDYDSFAILFRSNYLSRSLEEMCRRYQIPYQLIGGLKFYDRKEIKDLLAYMRIIVNPRDWTSFSRALGVPSRGVGAKSQDKLFGLHAQGMTLAELMDEAVERKLVSGRGLQGLKEFRGLYASMAEAVEHLKPSEWLATLVEALDYRAYLEKTDVATADFRVANVDELLAAMQELERDGVDSLAQFMDFSALVSDQDELDAGEPRVSLMTVHAAKGLEFDCVFVMGLEDGVFPNQRSVAENPTALEEERRLFYVAVTRARKRLFLSYAQQRQTYGSVTRNHKSRFLVLPESQDDAEFSGANVYFSERGSAARKPKPKVKIAELGDQLHKMERQLEQRNVAVDFSGVGGKAGGGPRFKIGDEVRHFKFGAGRVLQVRHGAGRQTVTVYFPGHGRKTLDAAMAKLEKAY